MFSNMSKKVGLFLTAMLVSAGVFAQQAAIDTGPIVTEINNARTPLVTVGAAIIGVSVVILVVRMIKRLIG